MRRNTAKRKRDNSITPVGSPVDSDHKAGLADPEYRAEHERLAPFEALARIVIMSRATLGISQAELVRRMGTTRSVVSRIESGQHATNSKTLKRLAEALGGRAVLGVEFGPEDAPEREPVVL